MSDRSSRICLVGYLRPVAMCNADIDNIRYALSCPTAFFVFSCVNPRLVGSNPHVKASVKPIRDAILKLNPAILSSLCQSALAPCSGRNGGELYGLNNSQSVSQAQYVEACVSMLSAPLPDSFAYPAEIPNFILRLIEITVERPCKETLQALFKAFCGIRGNLLEIMPDGTMVKLQYECTKILRNLDDHMSSLLCLAIFAKIASMPRLSAFREPRWFQSICQFFDATRGLKALDVAFLCAILAYSGSSTLSSSERIECLHLAKEICDVVNAEQKKVWITTNKPKIIKLCEKILKSDSNVKLQTAVSEFGSSLRNCIHLLD